MNKLVFETLKIMGKGMEQYFSYYFYFCDGKTFDQNISHDETMGNSGLLD